MVAGTVRARRVAVATLLLLAVFLAPSLLIGSAAHAADPDAKKKGTTSTTACPVPYTATGCKQSLSPAGIPLAPADDKASDNINRIKGDDRQCTTTIKGVCVDHAQIISQGFAWYALVAALIGICVSAASWALGSQMQNPQQQLYGKKGFILCLTAAFLVGSVTQIMGWLDNEAAQMDQSGVIRKG